MEAQRLNSNLPTGTSDTTTSHDEPGRYDHADAERRDHSNDEPIHNPDRDHLVEALRLPELV